MRRVEAVVQTGPVETPYVRVGRGAPVLLLVTEDGSAAVSPLLEALAPEFRLLLPALGRDIRAVADTGQAAFCHWLRDFMDALGIDRFALIAAARFAPGIAAFMGSDPDRVVALLLLTASGAPLRAVTPLPADAAQVRELCLDADGSLPAAALTDVIEFLQPVPPAAPPAPAD